MTLISSSSSSYKSQPILSIQHTNPTKGYVCHLRNTHKPDPAHEADSIWKDKLDFRAAEVAKAAEQLFRFIPDQAGLTNATNARHIRPGQTSPRHGAIVTTPPSLPLRVETAESFPQRAGRNRTPDKQKFPTLPSVTTSTATPQSQDHPRPSMAETSGESFFASNRSLVGDMQYPTEISKNEPSASQDRLLGPLSKLKAKLTRKGPKARC
jgi:hypothetical protein